MSKRFWSNLLLTTALATAPFAAGCRMCCPSYDYCGPTEPGESNSEYCGMQRRGSILGGGPMYADGATYVEDGTTIEEYEDGGPLIAPPEAPQRQPAPPRFEDHSARRTR